MSQNDPQIDKSEAELKAALAAFGADPDLIEDDDDAEVKAALAAFGADPDLFDDDDELIPADYAFRNFPGLNKLDDLANSDSPRLQWMKRLTREIYTDRLLAHELDEPQTTSATPHTENRYMCFLVGEKKFGIPLESVIEIAKPPAITRLPGTPSFLRGIANLRGTIYSVVDFRNLSKETSPRPAKDEKLIAIRGRNKSANTTLLVDLVIGIETFEELIDDLETFAPESESFASSLACSEDESITTIVDTDKLLACTERFSADDGQSPKR